MKRKQGKVAYHLGLWAEIQAKEYLLNRGYVFLAKRFRTPVGEIDLLFRDQETYVLCEVKARPTYDASLWCLTERQKKKLIQSASWLAAHGVSMVRIDLIWVFRDKIRQEKNILWETI